MMTLMMVLACTRTDKGPVDTDTDDTSAPTETVPVDTDTDTDPPVDTSWYDDADPTPRCELGGQILLDAGMPPEVPATWQFVPAEPGAVFLVERGNQGWWHIYASVRCHNVVPGDDLDVRDPNNPLVTWHVDAPDGSFLAGYDLLPRPMNYLMAGEARLYHEILVWRVGTYEDALNRDAVLNIRLTDVDGATVSATLPIRLEPLVPPDPPVDTDPLDTDG